MSTEELKKTIKDKFDAEFVSNIKHFGKEYIRAVKVRGNLLYYLYLQQDDTTINEVTDKSILEYLKKYYSSENSNIIY